MYSLFKIFKLFKERVVDTSGYYKSIFFLLITPAIATLLLVLFGIRITSQLLEVIIPAMSILVGFSFNSVILLLRYSERTNASEDLMKNVRTFSIYSIIVGLLIVVVTIGIMLTNSNSFIISPNQYTILAASILLFFLLGHYLFTILLLPARIFVIVENAQSE